MAVLARETADRPTFGILLMLAAWFLFALVDTSAKWLVLLGIPSLQLAFMRYAGHFAISIAVIARGGIELHRFKTPYFWALMLRSALLVSATVLNFTALSYLSLTTVSAIMFFSPVIVCALAWPLLGERIGPWRFGAILLGLAGVLTVIRPSGEAFHIAMLLPVYNAFSLALYSILTRKLAGVVATDTMQLYMGALGTCVLLPFALWFWESPTSLVDWTVLISLGFFGWLGHQFLTNAHLFGSATALMPYTYSFMIYLTITSYIVFDQVPDFWTIIGALIIILAGLIIWKREQR